MGVSNEPHRPPARTGDTGNSALPARARTRERAQRPARRGRHCKLGNDDPNVRKARAKTGDDRFRRFRRAAGAVQNQVEAIAFEALADLHERLHVLVTDGDQPGRCVPLQPPRSVEDDVPPGMSMKLDEVLAANAVEVRGLSARQLGEELTPDGQVEASLPGGSACLGRVGCR